MGITAFLIWLIIIWYDTENGINPRFFCFFSKSNRLGRIIRSYIAHDQCLIFQGISRHFEEFQFFVFCHDGPFASCRSYEDTGTFISIFFCQIDKGFIIDRTIFMKWRNHRRYNIRKS